MKGLINVNSGLKILITIYFLILCSNFRPTIFCFNCTGIKSQLTPTPICKLTVCHVFGDQECGALDKHAEWTLERKASGS